MEDYSDGKLSAERGDRLARTPSQGGKNYYISFIDDCSKFCYVYLLHTKDEALEMFKKYKAEVENQLEKRIKILRSDRGVNMNAIALQIFVLLMVLYIKQLPLILHNKMELLNVRIER